ncbi:MAG: addiction module protein [Syntrophobacteraceae bacterium]|nr:addiction module protein [Syntrophobacteraceae bacterium]
MVAKLDEVLTAALHLSIEERAQVVAKLLLSLDEPSESEVERLWLEEAKRRLNEFREGRVQATPAEDVSRRALDDIS